MTPKAMTTGTTGPPLANLKKALKKADALGVPKVATETTPKITTGVDKEV